MNKVIVKKLNTFVIHVKDLDASIAFYRDILGFHEEYVEDGMAWYTVGDEGNVSILLHITDKPELAEKGVVLDFVVENLENAITLIKNTGYKIVQEPIDREWGVKEAVVEDPNGYKIWLVEPLT